MWGPCCCDNTLVSEAHPTQPQSQIKPSVFVKAATKVGQRLITQFRMHSVNFSSLLSGGQAQRRPLEVEERIRRFQWIFLLKKGAQQTLPAYKPIGNPNGNTGTYPGNSCITLSQPLLEIQA